MIPGVPAAAAGVRHAAPAACGWISGLSGQREARSWVGQQRSGRPAHLTTGCLALGRPPPVFSYIYRGVRGAGVAVRTVPPLHTPDCDTRDGEGHTH
jgi:hypothetical protein